MTLGTILKEERLKRNWSLRQVETKLKNKGIKYVHSSIQRLEDDEHDKAPISVVSALAEIYGLDKITLFNLANANIERDYTPRYKTYDEMLLNGSIHFFNDEKPTEEAKKAILDAINRAYYEAQIKNPKKLKK